MSDEMERADDELSFSAAMTELERILSGVEAEETDIDVLGEELKRAAELLELCRGKIRRAEVEVTQIVQSLGESAAEPASEDDDSTPEPVDDDDSSGADNGEEELPF